MEEEKPTEKKADPYYDDRSPCEDCWMGEYKETGFRYCGNSKCPFKPGAGN